VAVGVDVEALALTPVISLGMLRLELKTVRSPSNVPALVTITIAAPRRDQAGVVMVEGVDV
jgi:hypothetical protein